MVKDTLPLNTPQNTPPHTEHTHAIILAPF